MASQAKWSQMMSQFSSRDDQIAKPPPPKRQKKTKLNLQFSQLDVHTVEASTSKASADNQKIEEPIDGWDSWSDDDNNLELDKLLSQYDRPFKEQNRQAKEVQQPKSKITNVDKGSEPATKLTVQVEIKKPSSTEIKNDAAGQQQVSSQLKLKPKEVTNKKIVVNPEQQPAVTTVKKNVKIKSVSPPKTSVESSKEPKEIANEMSTTTIEEINSLLDFNFSSKICGNLRKVIPDGIKNYVAVLEITQTLFEALTAEMMNVALPYQEVAICKEDLNFWRIFQFEEYSAQKDLLTKICHSLGKLVELNGTDRHLLGEAKKMTMGSNDADVWSVSCNSSLSPPNLLNAPLLLQQICLICDLAALKMDATALSPVICASVKFASSALVTQDGNSNDLIMWTLKRCCDVAPIPCVLYSLVEAIVQITSTKPDLINQHCSYDFKNHSVACFLSKIVDKSRTLLESSASQDCQQKTNFAVQIALKMTDFMDTVHFTPSYKLPPCLLLSEASSCLQNLFNLVGKIAISSNISTYQVPLVESLSGKMIKMMHWLYLTENNKFKEFTVDLRAELFYFLKLRRGKLRPDNCGDIIEDLLSRYSVWGAASNATSTEHSRQPSYSSKVSTPVAGFTDLLSGASMPQKNTDSGDYSTPCGSSEAKNASLKPPSVKKSLRLASRIGKR